MKNALFAAALLSLAACASTPPSAPSAPGAADLSGTWTFNFDAGPGVASSVLTDASGVALARISCQSPRGPLIVADWSYPTRNDPAPMASLALGAQTAMAPGRLQVVDGRTALVFAVPLNEPAFQRIAPDQRVATQIVGGPRVEWPAGSAGQFATVLAACAAK